MQPYSDPDQPSRPEDVDPVLTERMRDRAGMIGVLWNNSLRSLVGVAALMVIALLILWGLQSLGIIHF